MARGGSLERDEEEAMRRSARVRMAGSLFMLFIAITVVGCASLPEVGPFVDATAELRSAVAASGSTAATELRLMKGGDDHANRLTQLWAARAQAVDGLVVYAESLRSIVKAGQQGGQAARALADSVTGLAQAAGVIIPAARAVTVATDAAIFVYSHIALVRASHSLEEALVNAQPAVERVAVILAQDLKAVDEILQTANADIRQSRLIQHQVEWRFREDLRAEQKTLYAKDRRGRTAADEARLLDLDRLLTSTKVWYEPLQSDLSQMERRVLGGRYLIDAAIQITMQWADAHEQLVFVVRDRRTLNTQALVQAAVDIRDLIKRIREL
jgi:hypothetical protein